MDNSKIKYYTFEDNYFNDNKVNQSELIDTSNKLRLPCKEDIKMDIKMYDYPMTKYHEINLLADPINKSYSCSQRKRSLDWGDYRAPANQNTGRGFGNLVDWDKLYLGQDTRNDPLVWSARNIETTNLAMLPLDVTRIDYATNTDRYNDDLRNGIDTRYLNKKNKL